MYRVNPQLTLPYQNNQSSESHFELRAGSDLRRHDPASRPTTLERRLKTEGRDLRAPHSDSNSTNCNNKNSETKDDVSEKPLYIYMLYNNGRQVEKFFSLVIQTLTGYYGNAAQAFWIWP